MKVQLEDIKKISLPIVIISYNNYKYVKNTIQQLVTLNKSFSENILIMDNCSDSPETIDYLSNTPYKVYFNQKNNGPWLGKGKNPHMYNALADQFILTDADLEFNTKMPPNCIDIMINLSNQYECYKMGISLDISEPNKLFSERNYFRDWNKSIVECEECFWVNKVDNKDYVLYRGYTDTTFALYNKKQEKNSNKEGIRIAGNFTAKHHPWYIENKVYGKYENYLLSRSVESKISTISKVIIKHTTDELAKQKHGDMCILIPSRQRNHKIKELHDIWEKNLDKSIKTDCIILLDEDDEKNYDRLPNFKYKIVKPNGKRGVTYPLNQGAIEYCNHYDYIAFIGDDHRPNTKNWNSIIYNKLKSTAPYSMVYANDLLQGDKLSTFIFMDSWYVRTLGYMSHPKICHLNSDNMWLFIGKTLNNIHYLKDVIIEHLHYTCRKSDEDELYKELNHKNSISQGVKEYREVLNMKGFKLQMEQLKYYHKKLSGR